MAGVCRIRRRRLAGGLDQRTHAVLGFLDVFGQQLSVGGLGMASACLGAGRASVLLGGHEYPRTQKGGP